MAFNKSPFSVPSNILIKAKSLAPRRTVSENWGRGGGFHGDTDVTTRGYDSIMLYVRKGLGRFDIILEAIKFAFEVQSSVRKMWTLVPVSHGWGDKLKHLGTDYAMRYINESSRREQIAQDVCQLAGDKIEPGAAPVCELFPRADVRSLYDGKIKVTDRDLLVFVDLEDAVLFHCRLRGRIRQSMQKRMVLAGVSEEFHRATWGFAPRTLSFSVPTASALFPTDKSNPPETPKEEAPK